MKLILLAASLIAFASTAQAAVNLVPNGNFESGDTGFTSQYASTPAANTNEGQYTVRTNPFPWNPNFVSAGDHTTGTGQMMVANGAPIADQIVWQSALIAIAPSTSYFFEAFVMNVCCNANYTGPNSAPILTFSISLNGGPRTVLDTLTIPLSPAGIWHGLSTSFNSGTSTTATLYLVNANTDRGGNDFAVDDISLSTVSIVNPVPEPSSWLTMLLGFAAIGCAVRRRQARVTAAA